MLHMIDGALVYVVDLKEMPELPVWGIGEEWLYAKALTEAIKTGVISEPGKYGIRVAGVENGNIHWDAFAVVEPDSQEKLGL